MKQRKQVRTKELGQRPHGWVWAVGYSLTTRHGMPGASLFNSYCLVGVRKGLELLDGSDSRLRLRHTGSLRSWRSAGEGSLCRQILVRSASTGMQLVDLISAGKSTSTFEGQADC